MSTPLSLCWIGKWKGNQGFAEVDYGEIVILEW